MWICIGICAGIILKLFVIDFLRVSGNSMEPVIHDGSVILVHKAAFGIASPLGSSLIRQWAEPEKDDIVIYLYNNKIVVKRCVATGGTKLAYDTDKGYSLLVEGKKIPLTEEQYHRMNTSGTVPEGYILAVGDNYGQSVDSRTYGFVPVKNILGKILCR